MCEFIFGQEKNVISRIGTHVYAKGADTAITFYKDAFGLETKGEPWRDDNGLVISQNLHRKTGEVFMTICDYEHLPNEGFINKYNTDNCLTMLFFVFFSGEDEMFRAVEVLSENAKLVREAENKEPPVFCEIVDKFGVFWHLCVPDDKKIISDLDLI